MGLARSIDAEADTGITRAWHDGRDRRLHGPEQARNSKAADIRDDLYSLGAAPGITSSPASPPSAMATWSPRPMPTPSQPPPDPRRLNDRIPEAVVAVIQRLDVQKPLERHHRTAQELIDDLRQSEPASPGGDERRPRLGAA